MSKTETYFDALRAVLSEVEETQQEAMDLAADAIAHSFSSGGMLYTFGTGHSSLLAMELFYRAGGFARVCPLFEEELLLHISASASTAKEREEGTGQRLIEKSGCGENDTLLVFSNSGRNCVPVELAVAARKRGAKVIALTNLRHSRATSPRNPYNLHLYDAADIVLDNCGAIGDAALNSDALGLRFAPTSTAVGTAILWEIARRTINKMLDAGSQPEVFMSSNLDGGDAFNAELIKKYKSSIPNL